MIEPTSPWSLPVMAWSAGRRMAAAAMVSGGLWLMVAWALDWFV